MVSVTLCMSLYVPSAVAEEGDDSLGSDDPDYDHYYDQYLENKQEPSPSELYSRIRGNAKLAPEEMRLIVAPTLAGYVGYSTLLRAEIAPESIASKHFALSAGLSWNLVMNDDWLTFVATNLEVERVTVNRTQQVTYFMPMVQAGFSLTSCYREASFIAATAPCMRVYALGGVRPPPSASRDPMLRAGLGISSVFVPLFTLSGAFFVPSHYEILTETDLRGDSVIMLRVGIGF